MTDHDADWIESRLAELTVSEKVALVAGSDTWHTPPVPRVGIPAIKMSDGPIGVRGAGTTRASACFPCGTALAATWDTDLVGRIGQAIAEEAKTKGVHVVLAPTVNIHRHPLAGRNFECYSEDPYLTARMAVAYISGVQSRGVAATVKHFVCNDSEFERMSISSEVGPRALREIYLPPFEAAVKEAGTWALMASYNRVNGTFASENALLLASLLKQEWDFDGVVMSDWYGTKSTVAAVEAGLDLEMPGPPVFRGRRLEGAIGTGELDAASLDDSVRRLLRLAIRTGASVSDPDDAHESEVDDPAHRTLARQAAADGIVLLQNDEAFLPIDPVTVRSIAVIGPNAAVARFQGGGSARVTPHYTVSVLDAIRERSKPDVAIVHEPGCTIQRATPVFAPPSGLAMEWFDGLELAGEAVHTETMKRPAGFFWMGTPPQAVTMGQFSLRLRGLIAVDQGGVHTFSLISLGRSRLLLDGNLLVDNWTRQTRGSSFYGFGSTEVKAEADLAAGSTHEVVVEFACPPGAPSAGLTVGLQEPVQGDLLERAVSAASAADLAVVVVGSSAEWETEGQDRLSLDLPGRQDELVERVAAANPRTVVVVNTGSPHALPWCPLVPAVMQVWYGGQEMGHGIADVIFGDTDPGGRLPTTFPMRLEDSPAYLNYPGEHGTVLYGEGIFAGYRGYDRRKIEPRFCFGHGLTYTSFDYGQLEAVVEDGTVRCRVPVTNTGSRRGREVVQLYVHHLASAVARPDRTLQAFAKVELEPEETAIVSLSVDRAALAYWDPVATRWDVEAGDVELQVGRSSRDLRSAVTLRIE